MKNILFRKTMIIIFSLLIEFPLCPVEQPAYAEEFKICRLSSGSGKDVDCFNEKTFAFASYFGPDFDKKYYEDIKTNWHIPAVSMLRKLYPKINTSKKDHRNLCLLLVSIIYETRPGVPERKDLSLNRVFLSGANLSEFKPGSASLGLKMPDDYTVTFEPGLKEGTSLIESITEEEEKVFHKYLMQCRRGNIIYSDKGECFTITSLDDFLIYSDVAYIKSLIEYFRFCPVLADEQKEKIKADFEMVLLEDKFKGSASLQKLGTTLTLKEITERAKSALDEAFTYDTPFINPASNNKAQKYFSKTPEELFSKKTFKHDFCDSEQAIRLFILKGESGEWGQLALDAAGKQIDVNSIKQIYVNIASFLYMCRYCQGTYLYDILEKKDIVRGILRAAFYNQLPKPEEDSLGLDHPLPELVVYVSGTEPASEK